ncbi:IS200/IS605 family transposase [Leptospira sp. WS92.C1]
MKLIQIDKLRKNSRLTHSVYSNDYHLVFATRGKIPWLNARLVMRIRNLFREKGEELNLLIYLANGHKNHMHVLLSVPPTMGISYVAKHLKGYSSRRLGKKKYWGEGYYVRSVGDQDFIPTFHSISNQWSRHKLQTMEEEFKEFRIAA